MGQGDATVKFEFQTGNAAGAQSVLRAVYQNQNNMMRQSARQADMLGTSFRKLSRSMFYGAASYAGIAAVGTAVSAVAQGIDDVISKRAQLEQAITPFASLENNAQKLPTIRREVLATSLAVGRTVEEVGRMYADLVGSTGNLSSGEREQLIKETKELSELTGGTMVDAQNLLTKSYQIYAKELVNVNQLQNKLMLTQDEGSIEFSEMALRLPELLQSGKVAGMNIDEVLGTVIGATRRSGSIEKTMTGLRNMFLIMEEAPQRGVKLTGDYLNQLKQLQALFQTNAPKMQEMFGREVIVHASSVSDAIGDITSAIQKLGEVTGQTDSVAEKLAAKFQDPTYFATRDLQNIRDVKEQAPNLASDVVAEHWLMKAHRRGLLATTAVSAGTGGIFGSLASPFAYASGVLGGKLADEGFALTASTREGDFFRETMRQEAERKIRANQEKWQSRRQMFERAQFSEHLAARWLLGIGQMTGATDSIGGWISRNESAALQMRVSPHLLPAGSSGGAVAPSSGYERTNELIAETNHILSEIWRARNPFKDVGGARANYEEGV